MTALSPLQIDEKINDIRDVHILYLLQFLASQMISINLNQEAQRFPIGILTCMLALRIIALIKLRSV
jgi:hypothetical protein